MITIIHGPASTAEKKIAEHIVEAFKKAKVTVQFSDKVNEFTILDSKDKDLAEMSESVREINQSLDKISQVFLDQKIDLGDKTLFFEFKKGSDKKFRLLPHQMANAKFNNACFAVRIQNKEIYTIGISQFGLAKKASDARYIFKVLKEEEESKEN